MSSFAKDSRTENWLTNRGVPNVYKTSLRLSSLSPNWQRINHGRPDGKPIDDELVGRYGSALQEGAIFPAPILVLTNDGYEVLDGCQRLCGAELADITIFNAYVVNTDDPAKLEEIRICANGVLNGSAPTAAWTVTQIVTVLHEQFRYTAADCAAASGFKRSTIEKEINARHGRRWMESHGIDTTVKPANQSGFQATFNTSLPSSMLKTAPDAIVKVVRYCQKLRSNNNEADAILKEFTDIREKKHCKLSTQIMSKLHEIAERPEFKNRVISSRKRHPVENAKAAIASAVTACRHAQKHHSDAPQSEAIVTMLNELRSLVRRIVPRQHWPNETDVIT